MLNKRQKSKVPSKSYVYVDGNKPTAEDVSENGAGLSEQDQENVEENAVENEIAEGENVPPA